MIYEFALAEPQGIYYRDLSSKLRQGPPCYDVLNLAINYACRVMCNETMHLSLKANIVRFDFRVGRYISQERTVRFLSFIRHRSLRQQIMIRQVEIIDCMYLYGHREVPT